MRKIYLLLLLTFSISNSYAAEYQNYSHSYSLEDESKKDYDDPFESFNRKVFIFNSILDHLFLKPVAKGYKNIFSDYTRTRVGNVIDNLAVPLSTVNYGLQANIDCTLASFWKFVVNSILGVGGAYDVAEMTGITVESQTFGNVLAHYGVKPGPYVILPIYGSTNMRDVFDKPVLNREMNPVSYHLSRGIENALTATTIVEKRASILEFTDYISKNSPDPYTAIRSAMYQLRESKIDNQCKYQKIK